jgi:hypothetical protein
MAFFAILPMLLQPILSGGTAGIDFIGPDAQVGIGHLRISETIRRVQGRLLGLQIRPGMTESQVIKKLGRPDNSSVSAGAAGCFATFGYSIHGFAVLLATDARGELRVRAVSFRSIFD